MINGFLVDNEDCFGLKKGNLFLSFEYFLGKLFILSLKTT